MLKYMTKYACKKERQSEVYKEAIQKIVIDNDMEVSTLIKKFVMRVVGQRDILNYI